MIKDSYNEDFSIAVNRLKSAGIVRYDGDIAAVLGIEKGNFSLMLSKKRNVTYKTYQKLLSAYPELKNSLELSKMKHEKSNLIPLYADVYSIGSANQPNNSTTNGEVVEYIDAGDWFPGATSAIRHYGDSMREYPSGCILALKEIQDKAQGFVFGQDYVVEYGEDWNRVTKRVQQRKDGVLMGYSSNEDKYDDDMLIHQPLVLNDIHRAWRVLGYVVKKESGTGVVRVITRKGDKD